MKYFIILLFSFCQAEKLPFFVLNSTTIPDLLSKGMEIQGDMKLDSNSNSIDFGNSGILRIPNFSWPKTKFTIEAFVKVRSFQKGPYYISDILTTHTWDGIEQGVGIRFGGGIYYPDLPEDANSWNLNSGGDAYSFSSDPYERAGISQCLFEFVMATGETHHYKEYFSDRCVKPQEWVHLVSTWDGFRGQLYFNGELVTDTLRILSPNLLPNYNQNIPLYIGGRSFSSSDPRHFNGLMKEISIYDEVLNLDEIKNRSKYLNSTVNPSNICQIEVEIKSPMAGEICNLQSRFILQLKTSGTCQIPANPQDYIIEVSVSENSSFDEIIYQGKIGLLDFKLENVLGLLKNIDQRFVFWRFRFIQKQQSLFKLANSSDGNWSFAMPVYLDNLNDVNYIDEKSKKNLNIYNNSLIKNYLINGKSIHGNLKYQLKINSNKKAVEFLY